MTVGLAVVEGLVHPSGTTWCERRRALADVGVLGGLALLPEVAGAAMSEVTVPFAPDVNGESTAVATFSVPTEWTKLSDTTQSVVGGRRLVVYASPDDTDWNVFLLLTPIRGDYTSLGSFGTLDAVQDTIIPRGDGIDAQLISSASKSSTYVYEYTLAVPNQPKRHLKTIFSLVADTLVTFNVQALEDTYTPDVAKISESILSTAIAKKTA
eukprot:CAMPEP_0197423982 /NCGR_PEP_ID=MMETSP1170-20131217/24002_1 /TAXON_ID=54406 /ORGANISM="Sarcinochrysis sp, Strain CCMP770" /LENGTH=210 /DNA_ID=CAMNT_0042951443 /DNA_START=65 /DNA_END=697 /DNA_ORIENTATION=-